MVGPAAPAAAALGHDSTIYVLSQLPVNVCDEILQAISATKHSFHDNDVHPWHIQNRYYSAEVQFKLMDSPEHLLDEISTSSSAGELETPAVVLVVDSSRALDEALLDRFDTSSIDVLLVVGRPEQSPSSRNPEDNMELCLKKGYEYIDLSEVAEDDTGGQTGLARLSEALQAHIWPNSQMVPRTGRTTALVSDDEEHTDQLDENPHQSEQTASRSGLAGKGSQSGFEDDFTPFVSSSTSEDDLDSPNFIEDDEDDPTAHLTSMFASLVGMREQALAMPNDERRKDFAADMALKFARQLDAMLGGESDDLIDGVEIKEARGVRKQT